jgi:putative ABC transport system permease protein
MATGDSVRATLVNRVTERLGNTETIVFSRNSFMSEKLLKTGLFNNSSRGILLVNGFISQNGKLTPVLVWGVDDMDIPKGGSVINTTLADEILPAHKKPGNTNGLHETTAGNTATIVLRLPSTGLVPSGSLFVTGNYTTSMRLSFSSIVDAANGGNISMKNEQILPSNIFVNRSELADILEAPGKINLILSAKNITEDNLSAAWDYSSSGLSVIDKENYDETVSDRIFIQKEIVDYISQHNNHTNRLFSYLANTISHEKHTIPYSFVTAVDCYKGDTLLPDEVILSDYSSRRLNARTGDNVEITYYTSQDFKALTTKSVLLKVKKIVPLAELYADSALSANFPGLSGVERCTDWDSDLPINMDLITDEDEKYWEQFRTTPKAIIPYEAIANDWSNEYGSATALRVSKNSFDGNINLGGLTPEMFGIKLIHPREAGIHAAENGVDFSSLFLSLGFFIIISAILLMLNPLSEMLYVRRDEINTMKALGYPKKRIIKILWTEALPVVVVSSIIGVITGLLYTSLIMWLLGNVWQGATQTSGFTIYPDIVTPVTGLIAGIALSLSVLRITIIRSLKEKKTDNTVRKRLTATRKRLSILFSVLSFAAIAFNIILLHSVALFTIAGILLICTAYLWGDYVICNKSMTSEDELKSDKLIWSTLYNNKKQAALSFFALTTGVFIVFSVGLNRRGFADSSQIRSGTGGYSLWMESAVPVYHNLATAEGRKKLSLTGLPSDAKALQCLRYGADDASCLNLNKVSNPTVLGIDMGLLAESDFKISQSRYNSGRDEVFKQMQLHTDSVYPALIDETVLTWGLMMKVGDTLKYKNDNGKTVCLQLIGTLENSIFQGNILIDRNLFRDIWPGITGSEVVLLQVNDNEKDAVGNMLSQALHEYGVKVSATNDRLKQFNVVTDTYLTIFLMLGGLGLLLGIMSFIIVVRKNLAMRKAEIELYATLGYTKNRIRNILNRENMIVPLYAIITGVVNSLVGVSASFMNTSVWIWLTALLFTLFFVVCVVIFVRKSVKNEVEA